MDKNTSILAKSVGTLVYVNRTCKRQIFRIIQFWIVKIFLFYSVYQYFIKKKEIFHCSY